MRRASCSKICKNLQIWAEIEKKQDDLETWLNSEWTLSWRAPKTRRSATNTPNFSSLSVKLTELWGFLAICFGSHFELGQLQQLGSWRRTPDGYFLHVSLKYVRWFMRYLIKRADFKQTPSEVGLGLRATTPCLGQNLSNWLRCWLLVSAVSAILN